MPPPPNWTPKMYLDKNQHSSVFDKPLELTMNKNLHLSNKPQLDLQNVSPETSETAKSTPLLPFSGGSISGGSDLCQQQQDQMVLPPPPPLWYPPLYPPGNSYPSTFDPLHFFIDLRVSGHIYDRKTGINSNNNKDQEHVETQFSPMGCFKQSRHCSAFSVPTNGSSDGNCPMNLMTNSSPSEAKTKFDVKSMGFDKTDTDTVVSTNTNTNNKTSTNYIMQNIDGIYKNINSFAVDNTSVDEVDKDEEERKKKERDLRALIGLELVVDYMSHTRKKVLGKSSEDGEEVEEPGRAASPTVEVVAVTDSEI